MQQKILWAEVRKETEEWKSRCKNQDLFADRRCRQAVLDFLSSTDVGRYYRLWKRPTTRGAACRNGSSGSAGSGKRVEDGGGGAARWGGTPTVPTHACLHGIRGGVRGAVAISVVISFVVSLVRISFSSGQAWGARKEPPRADCGQETDCKYRHNLYLGRMRAMNKFFFRIMGVRR